MIVLLINYLLNLVHKLFMINFLLSITYKGTKGRREKREEGRGKERRKDEERRKGKRREKLTRILLLE